MVAVTDRQVWAPGGWIAVSAWLLWSVTTMVVPGMTVDDLALATAIGVLELIVAILVSIALHAVLHLAHVNESRRALIAVHATMGAAAGLTVVLVGSAAQLPHTMPPIALVLVSAIIAAWFLDAMESFDRARKSLAEQREALITEAATLVAASASQEALLSDLRSSIVTAVDMELAPARAEVSAQLALLDQATTLEDWPTEASPLHDVAHDTARPLAMLIDAPAVVDAARISPWGMVLAIARTQPFHPLPLSAIYTLVTFPIFWEQYGILLAILGVAIGVTLICAITMPANAIMRSGRLRHEIVFFATFVILQLPGVAVSIGDGTFSQASARLNLLVSSIVSFTVVFVTSGLGSWHQRQMQAQAAFREQLDEERVVTLARGRLGALVARDAARTLHGPVQARLAACAVAIDTAVQTRDIDAYAAALREAQSILLSPLSLDGPRHHDRTVQEVLADVVALWRGLLGVEVIVDPPVAEIDGPTAYDVERVIEEAVTNAVRHGGATSIVIEVAADGEVIDVIVTDNGQGPMGGAPGLGSSYLDELTNHQWSLQSARYGSGSTLTAHLPCILAS